MVAMYKFLPDSPPRAFAEPNLVLSRHTPLEARKYSAGAEVVPELPKYMAPPLGQLPASPAGSEPYETITMGPLPAAV